MECIFYLSTKVEVLGHYSELDKFSCQILDFHFKCSLLQDGNFFEFRSARMKLSTKTKDVIFAS